MHNAQIADVFDQVADLLEFDGANPFRVRAYRNAARTISELPEEVTSILAEPGRELTELPGVGKDLAEKIATVAAGGSLPMLDELLSRIPKSVLALLRIPGVGPKKAASLFHELKVSTLEELRRACLEEKVRSLSGFGAKTEQTILAGLDLAARAEQRIYWAEADRIVGSLMAHMREAGSIERLEMAGSYRRGRETVGDLDLLVVSREPEQAMDCLAAFPGVAHGLVRGETKMSVRLESGLQIDLRVVPAESFGAALQYFTGSKAHNVILRGLAKQKGLRINEWGVFRLGRGGKETRIAGSTEREVYRALGLPCFPPELREGRQEFDWAAAGPLPRLVELGDLRGDLHAHTNATDGKASLEEMVAAAKARGLSYVAITDHSQRVRMAHGMGPKRLRQQWAAIDRLRESVRGIKVLKGIECDILEEGGLDLPDGVLAEADWVVASVHYGQRQSREQITRRILGAIDNPHVAVIAHPTGRLINRRDPYELDLEAVIEAARCHGKMLELNANPARLDLDDVACAAARRRQVPIVISSDAHTTDGFDVLRYGVLQGRRGGLTADDVANTWSWQKVKSRLGRPVD
jgi:DNA polymerase (family 10)